MGGDPLQTLTFPVKSNSLGLDAGNRLGSFLHNTCNIVEIVVYRAFLLVIRGVQILRWKHVTHK